MAQDTQVVSIRMPKKLFKIMVKASKAENRSLSKQIIMYLDKIVNNG